MITCQYISEQIIYHIHVMQEELGGLAYSIYRYPGIEFVAFAGVIRLVCVWDAAKKYVCVIRVELPKTPDTLIYVMGLHTY